MGEEEEVGEGIQPKAGTERVSETLHNNICSPSTSFLLSLPYDYILYVLPYTYV